MAKLTDGKRRHRRPRLELSETERRARPAELDGETDGSDDDQSADDPEQVHDRIPDDWDRPDGLDEGAYEGWETWHERCWAWQFLRRNAAFAEVCLIEDVDRGWIASAFHLRQFKDFRQEYASGSRPKFASHGRVHPKRAAFERNLLAGATSLDARIKLQPTDVVVRFAIEPLLEGGAKALSKQLDWVETRLEAYAALLRKARAASSTRDPRTNLQAYSRSRLRYALRLLDWMHANPRRSLESATLALEVRDYTRARDWSRTLLLQVAMPLVNGGYVTLESAGVVDESR